MKKLLVCATIVMFATAGFLTGCGDMGSGGKSTFVTIGTGGITGVYYPTGGAIAKMINKKSKEYGIRATVESTGGSVFNINAIMAGDLDFGIAQSDRQYEAFHGIQEWDGKALGKLRAVFSIHPELITLCASVDSGINGIDDLRGKRVNIGNPGSGNRQNAIEVLKAAGMDYESDLNAEQVKAAEAPKLIQDGRIDAFFYTVGHPSGAFKEATAGRIKVRFVPITGSGIDDLVSKHPYLAKADVPVSNYPNAINDDDVPTIGVKATLVTSADVPEKVVYAITKEVFENFDSFKKLHPAYAALTKEQMLDGLSAPVHKGAMKYYKEAGLK